MDDTQRLIVEFEARMTKYEKSLARAQGFTNPASGKWKSKRKIRLPGWIR